MTANGGGEPAFRITFWGARGSIPTPGPSTTRYGGNTACVEVRAGEELIVLDAGSGIRELGLALSRNADGKPIRGSLLISHTHWDHIQGLPFFSPIYSPANHFDIYGAGGMDAHFKAILQGQMDPNYFPVSLEDLGAGLEFREIEGPELCLGDTSIRTTFTNHPGLCLAFRLERKKKTFVYFTDNEPYNKLHGKRANMDIRDFALEQDREASVFIQDADLLVYDAQYTEEEYPDKVGWGHSTVDDAVMLAAGAGVKRLALFHHDPLHDDDFVDTMVEHGRKLAASLGSKTEVFAACEGRTVGI